MFKPRRTVRVCIVAASLDILGGQAVQAARLLEGLAQERSVEAELLPVNPRLPGPLHWLQRIKYVRTAVTLVWYLGLLVWRLPRYDVVHVFSTAYLSFLLAPLPAVLVAKLYGKPVLLNYHSGEAEDHLYHWRRTVTAVVRWCDRLVVPSGFLVRVFALFGLQAEAVANTVEFEAYCYRLRQPLRPVLLANRNHEPLYNVAATLQAFQLIQAQVPHARLLVAGHGSQHAALQELARALNLQHVEFLGRVEPAEMPALYAEADLYLNSSEIDNMPLSLIQAFAAGLPVVTTDAGGIPYLVRHERTGLLVRRGDAPGLAAGVLRLLAEPAWAAELSAAARWECRRYTWEAVRSDWLHLYRELSGALDLRVARARRSPVA
jgi:glycosyltransferase involved in cell wall biosynthesis